MAIAILLGPAAEGQDSIKVVSAADFSDYPISPGSLISVFGQNFTSGGTFAAADQIPQTPPVSLGGASVAVTDSTGAVFQLPLLAATPSQINALVPSMVATGNALFMTVSSTGQTATYSTWLERVGPSLFTADQSGTWLAAAQVLIAHADGSQTLIPCIADCSGPLTWNGTTWSHCVPLSIDIGGPTDQAVLILYGTGIRGVSQVLTECPACGFGSGVEATNGLSVSYAGPQGGGAFGAFYGLDQVNIVLPQWMKGYGRFDLSLAVLAGYIPNQGGMAEDSNTVSMFVQ